MKKGHQNRADIPNYELLHKNKEVAFAIRSTKDVLRMFGANSDKPHRHNYYTVLWSHNYSGKHIVDYHEFEMRPNDVFFVSPGQVHQVIHSKKPDGTVILFTCEFLEKNAISESFIENLNLFSEISITPPLTIDENSAEKMKSLITEMRKTFTNNLAFKDELIGAYLKLFLIECNRFAHEPLSDHTQAIQSGKIILKKFKDLLDANYSKWRKVSEYASEMNLSSDYLNNVIKSTIGKTAKELIQQRINLEAKRLGLHTELTTKEIAYRIGFDDPSHFSKFFRNNEGVSFSEFRTALSEELNR
jgi:AraC-like DNA-binding protein